ncbi:MAG TPA: AAA family ATPase [Polyangiaceae bacterium]|nr:AAA family ATPase [Polyangiaceae bacterium]
MLKLKRLKINKFRHVVPTELVFDDRYNVPLGINGSGKTTLLKLISACLRSDFSEYKAEEIDVEYELSATGDRFVVGVTGRRGDAPSWPQGLPGQGDLTPPEQAAERPIDFSVIVLVSLAAGTTFRIVVGEGQFRVSLKDEAVEVSRPGWRPITAGPFLAQLMGDSMVALAQSQRRLLQRVPIKDLVAARAAYRFDESLELLLDLLGTGGSPLGGPVSVLMQVSLGDDGRTRSIGGTGPLSPRTFLWASERQLEELTISGKMTFRSDDTEGVGAAPTADPHPNFLDSFARIAGFANAELALRVLQSEARDLGRTFLLGAATFRFVTKRGDSVSHELLSYGQKRLLSFLYYVACNDAVVVADELVNGLHHAWIGACLDAIGERQAFLTSQNPILLDFLPPTSPEEAARRFIRCVLEEREGRDVMVWRNLTPDEASELCKQYAVGIQQLSELLRVNGLW